MGRVNGFAFGLQRFPVRASGGGIGYDSVAESGAVSGDGEELRADGGGAGVFGVGG